MSYRTKKKLWEIPTWKWLLACVLISELLTFILSCSVSYALWGKVSSQVLIIGVVDSFLVSLVIAGLLLSFVHKQRENARLREDIEHITKHDLKSPLQLIIGAPTILLEEADLTELERTLVQKIQESGYRMLNMINLSLDIYKIEHGLYEYMPESVDIMQTVQSVLDENRNLIDGKHIQVLQKQSNSPDEKVEKMIVQAEELLCYSIFSNCIKNSLEASPEGGEVNIVFTEGSSKTVSIHNQGAVPESIRGVFFDKYSTAGKREGTGLGTYSAKLMVNALGGDISMQTSDEHGTTVLITFN
ncbi:ATP-binding protein [Maridesulfovibrio sp.]|uniref:sensor histidine kinase n=1 Tax=Maridesulfovibrio sp. TaxID=2795000 RepID=UPI002A18D2F7|nr:ATP-binding protein [Maridesulfovibrio sp.]